MEGCKAKEKEDFLVHSSKKEIPLHGKQNSRQKSESHISHKNLLTCRQQHHWTFHHYSLDVPLQFYLFPLPKREKTTISSVFYLTRTAGLNFFELKNEEKRRIAIMAIQINKKLPQIVFMFGNS